MDRMFDVGKVGCYLENISHSTEKRKDGEHKVIVLTLRVEPFDTKLAAAVSQEVRQTLYRMGDAQPWAHVQKAYFALGVPRQQLKIFATPDTAKPSIALDQVLVTSAYARTIKDARGYSLVFRAAFGPVSAGELEYCERWRNSMAFVTFHQAAHDEQFDLEPAGDVDDAEADETQQPMLPEPEFETDGAGKPVEAAEPEPARHRLHSHAAGRKRKAARKGRR